MRGWQRQDFPWHDALKCCELPLNNATYAVKKEGCEKLSIEHCTWCILTSRMEGGKKPEQYFFCLLGLELGISLLPDDNQEKEPSIIL